MQIMIRKTFVLLIAAIVMTAGFGLTLDPASAVTGPTSITIKAESGTTTYGYVDIYGNAKIYVSSVYPSTRSKSVTWSLYSGSAYGKIVSKTSSYCYVQGIKAGTVVIKARSSYYPYAVKYITVYVRQLYISGVTVTPSPLHMWAGTQSTLTAKALSSNLVKPWVYNPGMTWTASDTGVNKAATVGTTGIVSALRSGSVVMTATSKDYLKPKASSTVNVYDAAFTSERVDMAGGTSLDNPNPLIVTGPGSTEPPYTVTYQSSNTAVATVDSTGKVTATDTAFGSATITATVKIDAITATTKTKSISYVVNTKKPMTETEFSIGKDWGFLEVTHNPVGGAGETTFVLQKSQIDDLFGYGSLGIDLWNPMDMYLNFQATDIAWHAGGFDFDKAAQTDPTNPDVVVSTDSSFSIINHLTYWLNDGDDDSNCVNLAYDGDGLVTGYSVEFYYDNLFTPGAYDQVTLDGNQLTMQFDTFELTIKRLASNKVQVLDNTGAPVLTIVRDTTGYRVVVENTSFMTDRGIVFSLYNTYI